MAKTRMSATQRTIRELRNQGRICAIAEKFNSHVGQFGIRQDLFGFIDIVALDPSRGIIGVQCFTTAHAEHYRKITQECHEEAVAWLQSGGRIELWGWRKLKVKRGGAAMRWTPRLTELTMEDFE